MSGHHRMSQSEQEPSSSNAKDVYVDEIKQDSYSQDGEMIQGLSHHEDDEIIHEEILHEDILEAEDVEIEYIDGDDVVGAEEVVMDDVVMEDDIATESLVALSRGPNGKNKGMRAEYLQHTLSDKASLRPPRILRRSMVDRGAYVYEQPVSRQQVLQKPNFPVPQHTKRLLPVATLPPPKGSTKDWREEQKRMLEIYEIYDCLPEGMKDSFKRILESKGENIPPRVAKTYRITGNQVIETRDFRESEHTAMRQRQFKEGEQVEDHHHVEDVDDDQKKPMDPSEYSDMPQLEEAADGSSSQGQQAAEAQIDVEGYDSADDGHLQEEVEYIMDDGVVMEMYDRDVSPMKMERRPEVIMPEMREEYLGTMDANTFAASQIMMGNQYTDSRFCPGCKLHLKRSIFYHHSRMIKKYGICNMFTPKRFPCGIQGCDERLGTVEKLCEHMLQIHGSPTEIKTEVFNNETEFDVFLRELESKGGNFRMSRGNKMIKAGLVQYFRCNRTQSLAKDKTMRICDEVGLFGEPVGSGAIDRQDDPFSSNSVGGKPCLRTEEACTAFFRKAYMSNGTIEVRYCDHHLHDDERVRLPPQVKERICEMHKKGLPAAVIMMVLQCEREKFALVGTCVERRIMQLTPKDISAVISTKNSNAKKRRRIQPTAVDQMHGNGDAEEDPNQNLHEMQLTELEQRMLETFEANQDIILGDMQKMKRVENRKRNQRETIRNHVFALGRFIRTSTFSEMQLEQLEDLGQAIRMASECAKTRPALHDEVQEMQATEMNDGGMMQHKSMELDVETVCQGDEMNETVKQDVGSSVNIVTVPYIAEEIVDDTEHLEEADSEMTHQESVMSRRPHKREQLVEDRRSEEMEQIVVETEAVSSPPAKKRRGRRPKVELLHASVVKQEKEDAVLDVGSASPFGLPPKTSSGRVVRPSQRVLDL